jgi:uncharacterized phage-associated protein
MADVNDVAAAIIERQGTMGTWKLQKLVYYCQAWHLVWEDKPLFPDRIEAWANGPVVRSLYDQHRGRYEVTTWTGDPSRLTEDEVESIEAVLKTYGDKTGFWLSELTHQEPPWMDAREGLSPGERGNTEISHGAMVEYYGGLV